MSRTGRLHAPLVFPAVQKKTMQLSSSGLVSRVWPLHFRAYIGWLAPSTLNPILRRNPKDRDSEGFLWVGVNYRPFPTGLPE